MTTMGNARPGAESGTGVEKVGETSRKSTQSAVGWDPRAAYRRRYQAALRLPPMDCGCRDPESRTHRDGLCRYRRRRAA